DLGFTVIEQKQVWQSRVGNRWLGEDDDANWDRAVADRLGAIAAVGASGLDVPASSVPAGCGPWSALGEAVITWYMSVDRDRVLQGDVFSFSYTNVDGPIVEGYGALVARYGEGLPVSLATPATRIAWGDHAVTVETPKGTVRARAAIIAVPTNVLAGESIR